MNWDEVSKIKFPFGRHKFIAVNNQSNQNPADSVRSNESATGQQRDAVSVGSREKAIQLLFDLTSPLSPLSQWEKDGIRVESMSPSLDLWGPFSDFNEQELAIEKWVAEAPDDGLDTLIDVALNPPFAALREDQKWRYQISCVLDEWARQRPDGWLEKVLSLLSIEHTRWIGLSVIIELDRFKRNHGCRS